MMLKLLSPDEIIVLRFLAEGYSNSQISDRLFVPVSKVKQDVKAILNKLGLKIVYKRQVQPLYLLIALNCPGKTRARLSRSIIVLVATVSA